MHEANYCPFWSHPMLFEFMGNIYVMSKSNSRRRRKPVTLSLIGPWMRSWTWWFFVIKTNTRCRYKAKRSKADLVLTRPWAAWQTAQTREHTHTQQAVVLQKAGVKSFRRDHRGRDAPDPKALMDMLLLQTVFHKVILKRSCSTSGQVKLHPLSNKETWADPRVCW